MTPSVSSEKIMIKGNTIIPLLCLLIFMAIAGYAVSSPGLYYDELLYVNAALGAKIDSFIYVRLGDLPLMLMPYLGALKAWIYYPVFKLFGVTAYSIRWPVVAIGVLTLWINYRFMKTAFSRSAAILFLLLASVEPSTLFHTRLDWGPTAFMMLFRGLLLLFIFCWIQNGKPWLIMAAFLVSILGVFDKLNFIWFVSAAFISLILIYPGRVLDFVKSHRRTVIALGFLGMAFIIGFMLYAITYLHLSQEVAGQDWSQRGLYMIRHMLRPTVAGGAVYGFIVGDNEGMIMQQLIALGIATLAAMSVMAFTKSAPGEWRNLSFIFCFSVITGVQMFFTEKATGPHHAAMLAPLWLIPIAVWLGRAFERFRNKGRLLQSLALAAVAVVMISSAVIDAAYIKDFQNRSLNPRWSMASYDLIDKLEKKSGRPVVCVDWGLCNTIYALRQGETVVYDFWPKFKDGLNKQDVQYFEDELLARSPLFVTFAEGKDTFPETKAHFFDVAAERDWKISKLEVIHDHNHLAMIEIYEAGR